MRLRSPGHGDRPGLASILLATATIGLFLHCGCRHGSEAGQERAPRITGVERRSQPADPLLEDLQRRTFEFFRDVAHPETGLVPDRWPTESFSSVAAVGFGLTAYPIGVERGWWTREEARERVLRTLRFLRETPQGPEPSGVSGFNGFFYHFLHMDTGTRFEQVELSTIDTSLLLAGALFCMEYFDGDHADEEEIRTVADDLYRRVDWTWAQIRPPAVSMGWHPETGFIDHDWRGYDEAMILYILALGSPTHPVEPEAWQEYLSVDTWGSFYGYEHLGFSPLFGHQFSHLWIDFRGIQDDLMREKGLDYFENSRRAVLAQRAYAVDNPMGWKGYGANVWGLTACDGPVDAELPVDGETRRFFSYAARGASHTEIRDDGTIAPTAAAGSLPFAPEVVLPALKEMKRRWGRWLFGRYGFLDAFNPSFTYDVSLVHGRVVPEVGWFDTDYLGIDQGPIVIQIENHLSELVWERMRGNPYVREGLRRAGFTGGWLESEAGGP
jgi:hypothetical protein